MESTTHRPAGAWEFDKTVAPVFDDMARRSIPLYDMKHDLVLRLAARHAPHESRGKEAGAWLDLGCATGTLLSKARKRFGKAFSYTGCDRSQEMLELARELCPWGTFSDTDLRRSLPAHGAAPLMVVTCCWTAQFVPLEYRLGLFRMVREKLNRHGCFIIAEKLRGQNAAFQEALVDLYHDDKATHGYSVEAIRAKAEALEGRLVSYTAPELKGALQGEGFHVEEVARYLQFGLWYCLPK